MNELLNKSINRDIIELKVLFVDKVGDRILISAIEKNDVFKTIRCDYTKVFEKYRPDYLITNDYEVYSFYNQKEKDNIRLERISSEEMLNGKQILSNETLINSCNKYCIQNKFFNELISKLDDELKDKIFKDFIEYGKGGKFFEGPIRFYDKIDFSFFDINSYVVIDSYDNIHFQSVPYTYNECVKEFLKSYCTKKKTENNNGRLLFRNKVLLLTVVLAAAIFIMILFVLKKDNRIYLNDDKTKFCRFEKIDNISSRIFYSDVSVSSSPFHRIRKILFPIQNRYRIKPGNVNRNEYIVLGDTNGIICTIVR
jgi:hypothetical protein